MAIGPSLKYFRRLGNISKSDQTSLAGKAYLEQQSLNLIWFKTWNAVAEAGNGIGNSYAYGCHGQNVAMAKFMNEWQNRRSAQSKLLFYNSIKADFGYESYLDIKDSISRKHLARLRLSAHDLNIERGRYLSKGKIPLITDRICRFCCLKEESRHLELLEGLPYFNPILETEQHVITECPGYHHLRLNLSENLKSQLLLCNYTYILSQPILAEELGSFLNRSFLLRNPKKKKS